MGKLRFLPIQTLAAIRELESQNEQFTVYNLTATYNDYFLFDTEKNSIKVTDSRTTINENFYKALLQEIENKQKSSFENLYEAKTTQKRTPLRGVIVGKGTPSPFDSGITLHPQWGFPYIPATSWQGVLRNLIIRHYFDQNEENALNDSGFLKIFGSTDQRGCIDFLDAQPQSFSYKNLLNEINNNHYTEYYLNTSKFPSNFNNKLILHTYQVIIGITFTFRCGCISSNDNKPISDTKSKFNDKKPLEFITSHLDWLFEFEGIGARTKIGFGVFGKDKNQQ